MLEEVDDLQVVSPRKPAAPPRWRQFIRKNGALLSMASPGIVILLIFSYLPISGIIIAFKNFRANQGIWGSAWVGLDNFRFLFSTSDAWHITLNTLALNTTFIIT